MFGRSTTPSGGFATISAGLKMTDVVERIEVPCPACAERILAAAKKCKFCGTNVAEARRMFADIACPACAEIIPADARECPECREPLRSAIEGSGGMSRELFIPSAAPLTPVSTVAQSTETETSAHHREEPTEISFGLAVKRGWERGNEFEGRATRAEYWYFGLYSFLQNIVVMLVGAVLFGFGSDAQRGLYWIAGLVIIVPSTAVFVRRLHDTGRSGWWWWICLTVIGCIPLFVWLCEEGPRAKNRYGPPST